MKRTSTSKGSVDPDEAPRLKASDFDRARYRVAGKQVTEAQWRDAVKTHLASFSGKKRISIMLDTAVIEHFKAAAGERGYQTLINETLRKAAAGDALVNDLRTVLREELAAYKIK